VTRRAPSRSAAGGVTHAREHERIRAAYRYYDSTEIERRKRDNSNYGTRLNGETRWKAIRQILDGLDLRDGFRVLDVGCGAGEDLQRIAREFAHLRPCLHGIDLLPDRIEHARQAIPAAVLHVGGAENLPYPSQTFDVVLAATMFTSILDGQVASQIASEMTRVLSGSGTIICYDMRYPNPWNPHTRALRASDLQQLFPQAVIRRTTVTLIPPLARRLGGLTRSVYGPLHAIGVLRSHYVAEIRPESHARETRSYRADRAADDRAPFPPSCKQRRRTGKGTSAADGGKNSDTGSAPAPGRSLEFVRHTALTLGGLGCERALTFAAVTLLLRALPSAQGGAFVLLLKVAGVTGALTTLGLQAGAVRLISAALGQGCERWAKALLQAFLATRLMLAAALVTGAFLAGGWVASRFFGDSSATSFVEWGCVSAATNALLAFTLHHLQARQSFGRYTVLTVTASATRVTAIVLLATAGMLSASRAALLWALLPAVMAAIGLFLAPRDFLVRIERGQVWRARRELITIGRWLSVSALMSATFTNLDSLLVVRYLGLPRADLYGAAMNLSLIVVMLATAMVTVALPAISRLTEIHQIRAFFTRSLTLSSATAVILLPIGAAGPWLLKTVYGARFLPAAPAFGWLFAAALLTIVSATIGVVFLALRKPIHTVGQTMSQIAVALPCYLVLIPQDGMLGGAVGTFAGQAASLLYVLSIAPVLLRSYRVSPAPDARSPGYAP
jgi:O-antigen/teichoic acid export membrane protein/ubiquinone/menaquinone biosynthesis C-methylase UbiE